VGDVHRRVEFRQSGAKNVVRDGARFAGHSVVGFTFHDAFLCEAPTASASRFSVVRIFASQKVCSFEKLIVLMAKSQMRPVSIEATGGC
jgi:hypothetical protein